ncbi:MAG: response regulator [Gammaproteobacteria bacterium]|nr:response regulator [Gammaproteobacteria bacterium]MCP5406590.1 response regulator [Chromatiaceae bacterium]MCP5409446.1 response regulator [Chromatiaceae bacterium]MCP5444318.1 response regulator [Chromatiaceae bacterium]
MRVLIVDDELEWQELLTDVICGANEDVYVESAVDGFEAGRKVHWFKPDFVLMDLGMPGIDGVQLCRTIKTNPETAAIRVIAITGNPTRENLRLLLEAGAEHCLAKPLDHDKLLTIMGLMKEG